MSRLFPRPDFCLSTPARTQIRVNRAPLPLPLGGLKALFASDFHLRRGMDPDAIVRVMNGCRADLILLGGDFADTRAEALRLFAAFRALRAPLGIYAVRGNNDVEAFPAANDLAQSLASFGCRLLINCSVPLTQNGTRFHLGGLDEYKYGHPDVSRVFAAAPAGEARILLSHYPLLPEAAPGNMPDLMLSGHTHGGQFNAFGLTPYAIGFERFGKRKTPAALVSGAARFGRTTLLVSKGIGFSRIPLRIGVCQEIHLLAPNDMSDG